MRIVDLFAGLLLLLAIPVNAGQENPDFCHIPNTTTCHGEEINFTVYYSAAGLYFNAGSASFVNKLSRLEGHPVYHIVGTGQSNAKYDWIYKVRDRYESFVDTASMQPLKFSRQVEEGKTKKSETIHFNRTANTVTTDKGTEKVPDCIQDVLSAIYFARNIDYSKFKKEDKIPYKMYLENEVHDLYVKYLGREEIKTTFGRFRAIKFKAMLVEGTIFSGGENMTVWVTDDANKIPVRIQSSILIGSVKVDMSSFKNLRHPMTALVRK